MTMPNGPAVNDRRVGFLCVDVTLDGERFAIFAIRDAVGKRAQNDHLLAIRQCAVFARSRASPFVELATSSSLSIGRWSLRVQRRNGPCLQVPLPCTIIANE